MKRLFHVPKLFRRKRLAMRELLGLTSFLGVTVIALATAYISATEGKEEIRHKQMLDGIHIAKQVAKKAHLAILYQSGANIRDDMESAMDFPDVIRVEVITETGKSVVIAGVPTVGLPRGRPYWEASDDGKLEGETNLAWQFVAPVMRSKEASPFAFSEAHSKPIGFVRVVQSKESFVRLSQRVYLYSITFAGGLALLLLLVMRWVSMRITDPLTSLSRAFERAQRGESNVHVKAAGPYDIAAMAVGFNDMMRVLSEREADLLQHKATLEERLKERSAELSLRNSELMATNARLETSNKEMEAFGYTVSHDLRGPVKSFEGFLVLLRNECPDLPANALEYLSWLEKSTAHMNALIEGLLRLANTTRAEPQRHPMNLSDVAQHIASALIAANPCRNTQIVIQPDLIANADMFQMTSVLQNLLDNAWKFTSKQAEARIEVGAIEQNGETVFFVRDNGAGFDMEYAKNLFVPFQRMHSPTMFPGIGIGLATVNRIVQRHGGRIWAEAIKNAGATFFFTLAEKTDVQE